MVACESSRMDGAAAAEMRVCSFFVFSGRVQPSVLDGQPSIKEAYPGLGRVVWLEFRGESSRIFFRLEVLTVRPWKRRPRQRAVAGDVGGLSRMKKDVATTYKNTSQAGAGW